MSQITLSLIDVPGVGISVRTDASPPAVGQPLTPATALALDLLRLCKAQASDVRYGPQTIAALALARDLLNPEVLGHAVTPEVRDRARVALGIPPCEFRPAPASYGTMKGGAA